MKARTQGMYFFTVFCILILGCNQNQSGLQARVKQLEERVNFLEAAIARSQGIDIKELERSAEIPQGIMGQPVPSANSNSNKFSEPKSTRQSYTGRCQATTKKGTQCKRTAQSGSIYCWQHS